MKKEGKEKFFERQGVQHTITLAGFMLAITLFIITYKIHVLVGLVYTILWILAGVYVWNKIRTGAITP